VDLRPSVLVCFPVASRSRQVAVQRPAVSFVFRGPSCPSSSWSCLRLCCLLSRVQLPQQVVALLSAVLICFPGASFPSQVAILSWSGRGRAWSGSVGWGRSRGRGRAGVGVGVGARTGRVGVGVGQGRAGVRVGVGARRRYAKYCSAHRNTYCNTDRIITADTATDIARGIPREMK
jgi:hypothetical protein